MAMANPLKIHKTRAISESVYVFVCGRATVMQSMQCCSLKIKTNKLKSHAYARRYFCGVLLCTVRVRIILPFYLPCPLALAIAFACLSFNRLQNLILNILMCCTWKEHINRMILYNKIKSVILFLLCLHTLGWFTHARCAHIARSD